MTDITNGSFSLLRVLFSYTGSWIDLDVSQCRAWFSSCIQKLLQKLPDFVSFQQSHSLATQRVLDASRAVTSN